MIPVKTLFITKTGEQTRNRKRENQSSPDKIFELTPQQSFRRHIFSRLLLFSARKNMGTIQSLIKIHESVDARVTSSGTSTSGVALDQKNTSSLSPDQASFPNFSILIRF